MKKKIIGSILAIAVVLILVFIVYYRVVPDEYVPAADEIALHIQLWYGIKRNSIRFLILSSCPCSSES